MELLRESLQEFYKKNKKSSKIANSLNKLEDKKISRRSRSPSPPRQTSTKIFKSDQASNPPPSRFLFSIIENSKD